MIGPKYTSLRKLTIKGGSNGGLLVSAACNPRPDVYRVGLANCTKFVVELQHRLGGNAKLTNLLCIRVECKAGHGSSSPWSTWWLEVRKCERARPWSSCTEAVAEALKDALSLNKRNDAIKICVLLQTLRRTASAVTATAFPMGTIRSRSRRR